MKTPTRPLRLALSREGKIALAFFALCLALRLVFVTADPPLQLFDGFSSSDLVVEAPAKAHEARNRALFGAWKISPVDNYQFWRAQSPVWVYPLAGFFELFGVGYAQLRTFAALFSSLGVVGAILLAARGLGPAGVAFVGAAYALDFVAMLYGRSGMLEPAMNTLVLFGVLCVARGRDDVRWLFAAQWAIVAAFLTKQTAVHVAPVAAVFIAWGWARCRGVENRALWRTLLALHAVAALAALAWYVRTDAYWRSIEWNFNIVANARDGGGKVDLGAIASRAGADRADPKKLELAFALFRVVGPMALVEALRVLVQAARRRPVGWWRAMIVGWLACAALTLYATREIQTRYFLILAPPCTLLAGGLVDATVRAVGRATSTLRVRLARAATRALVAALAVYNATLFAGWIARRTYRIRDANAAVRETVGARDAVVVGLWAAPIVLETPYRHFYVKTGFNTSAAVLRELAPTHLVISDKNDYSKPIFERAFPHTMKNLPAGRRIRMLDRGLTLHTLTAPLGVDEAALKKKTKK